MRIWILAALTLSGALTATPARAFGECTATTYVLAFDRDGLPRNTCYEIARADIPSGGGKLRLLGVVGEDPYPASAAMASATADIARRTGAAMDAMGGLRVGEISVLLTRIPDPAHDDPDESFDAAARTYSKRGECFVTYYWPMGAVPEDYFKFLIAHEAFHCITQATVFHMRDDNPVRSDGWWVEGTAEYFANLAYPGTDYSDGYVSEFDAGSTRLPLWSFTYPSVVFFLWLSQAESPAAVSRFVRNVASASDDPHAALRRTVSDVAWKRFAEDYLDGEIRQPGGRVLPVQPREGRLVRIDGPSTPRVATAPYVVHRERWRFVRGKVYELQQTAIDPGVSIGFSRARDKWRAPPDTVLACDEDVVFRVLATTTGDAGEARYRAQPRRGMESPSACCLVGEWRPTQEARSGELATLRGTGAGAIAAAGGELFCALPQGDWRLRFDAEGRGEVEWQAFSLACEVAGLGGAWRQRWVRSGAKHFEWRSTREGAADIRHLDNTQSTHLTVRVGPMTLMDRTFPDPGPSIDDYGIAVTCLRDDLRVQGLDGLGHRSETYRRVPPPPGEPAVADDAGD